MSRLRIVCKGEPIPDTSAPHVDAEPLKYPRVNRMPAQWHDTELTLVSDDGSEHPIVNVTRVEWVAAQGTEPAKARLDFVDVDVELEVDLRPLEELEQAVIDWAESHTPAFGPNATERLAALADRLLAAREKRGAR